MAGVTVPYAKVLPPEASHASALLSGVVVMGAAHWGEFTLPGKDSLSHPMSAAQGMAWCLDPWCVSRHGVREARRPIRCLDDSSEGVLYAVPWVMEFRLKGVFDSRLWLTASLRGLIIHMLS